MIFFDAFMDEINKIANGDEEDMSGPAPSEEAVLKFLQKNPRPSDDQFHDWAEDKGFNVHKAEAMVYRVLSDIVNKGKSHGNKPAGIPSSEVRQGIKVEKEHTPSPVIARKVVADHHAELGKGYYPALLKMEKGMDKKGGSMVRCPITGKMVPKEGRGRAMLKSLMKKRESR